MAYYLDLFSPETYEAFSRSDRSVSGFRVSQESLARKLTPGDKLVCYVTKLSRWVGVLEVVSPCFRDSTPIFFADNDPFEVRFRVRPVVWLPMSKAYPIHEDTVWNTLSFTKGQN